MKLVKWNYIINFILWYYVSIEQLYYFKYSYNRPEPSLALGAVAISSDNSDDSTSGWLIPLVICFVASLCLLATAMLFYVKCFGTIPNRHPPKTRLKNFSNNRSHLIPSFARSYRSSNKASKQNNVNGKRKGSYLDNELSSSQSHCHQVGNNQQGFPRAELQLLPTSSESNFASASSNMRQSTLDKTDSVGRLEETKRLSQRYVKDRITSKTVRTQYVRIFCHT